MQKYILLIISIFFINCYVYAEELDVTFECPKEIMAGNKIECNINLLNQKKLTINGIQIKYEFEESKMISFIDNKFSKDWNHISSNSNGLVVVNSNGISENSKIATVKFITSPQIEVGKNYNLKFKNIKVSNSQDEFDIIDKTNTIKILSINDLVDYITVNGNRLKLIDGINNYEINVVDKKAEVSAKLKKEGYKFQEEYAPKVINNLKSGDNLVTLKVITTDTKTEIINYTINIKLEEKNIEENPKTGNPKAYIITIILFITAGILYYFNNKQVGGSNEKKS